MEQQMDLPLPGAPTQFTPATTRHSLAGLTAKLREIAPGAGIKMLAPNGPWSADEVRKLRQNANTVVHRARIATGSKFNVRVTAESIEIWNITG